MVSVLVGIVFIFFGGWGLIHWFSDFVVVAKGFGPFCLLVGGIIALATGIASFQTGRSSEKSKN